MDWAISTSLLPLSWLYGLGWRSYAAVYQVGFKKRWKPEGLKIVGVGNLEVGGLGKTPVTIALARILQTHGLSVAMSASAYGSPSSVGASIAPDGNLDAFVHGDEPALIRSKLPDVPLILGRERVAAAKLAVSLADVLLLDDGFQHLPLARDVDLLLWEANARNRRLIPAGPMREPVSGAKRAHAVLMHGKGDAPYGLPSFQIEGEGSMLRNLKTGEMQPAAWLHGRDVCGFCAIGRPERLFGFLEKCGAIVLEQRAFPDHDDLRSMRFVEGKAYVTTEKDAVKLSGRSDLTDGIWTRKYDVRFCDEVAVAGWLLSKLRER